HLSNLTVDLATNTSQIHDTQAEPWKVTLVDTGINSMTGGRIKRIQPYIGNDPFLLTYGDGVGDIDIPAAVAFHHSHGKALTVTAVQISGRFGALNLGPSNQVASFFEKPKGDGSWINGGFFVCQPEVFDTIEGDSTVFEQSPLEYLAKMDQMMAYKHFGFWKPMDTLRDKNELESMWNSGVAPWKRWE
ncbi:glucose-1-phosphate cytidylyltransferase, partial [bacterium]|nr:glucose-1-phosphate cytidylyltransferase [bacterium]